MSDAFFGRITIFFGMIMEKTTKLKAVNRFIGIGHALMRFQAMVSFHVSTRSLKHQCVCFSMRTRPSAICHSNYRSNKKEKLKMNKQSKIESMLLHYERCREGKKPMSSMIQCIKFYWKWRYCEYSICLMMFCGRLKTILNKIIATKLLAVEKKSFTEFDSSTNSYSSFMVQ